MPDIFDEVEEDLRADRMRGLLRRYGAALVAVALLVVAGVGGWQAWQWYRGRQAARLAEQYAAAVRIADGPAGADRQAAVPLLAAIDRAGGSDAYRTLARLREAALLADAGKLAEASALWQAVQNDGAADPVLRDVARLAWVQRRLGSGDPAQLATALQPLAAPENPFHGLAEEAQALLALRQGQTGNARDMLTQLSHDATASEGVRRRASDLLAQLGPATPAPAPRPSSGS